MTTSASRIKALDGLRGLAIILVLVGHLNIEGLEELAPLGVTLFFVLSGFLITNILTRQADSGGVRFAEFYRRRARRLLPALIPMLIVSAVLLGAGWWEQTWRALLYLGNVPLMSGIGIGNIGHTWSLAVEEHFYLVWPVVIAIIPSRWRFRAVLALLLAAGAWRLGMMTAGVSGNRIYFGTDTNAFPLLAGCLVSVGRFPRFAPVTGLIATAVYVGVELVGTTTLPILFALVPVAALMVHVASTSLPVFEVAWLRWFGTLSYGIYLWHAPLMDTFNRYRLIMLPVSVAVAWLSWALLERPILRRAETASAPPIGGGWRRRFDAGRRRRHPAAVTG